MQTSLKRGFLKKTTFSEENCCESYGAEDSTWRLATQEKKARVQETEYACFLREFPNI